MLRAAGHTEAADMLERLNALTPAGDPPKAAPAEREPEPSQATRDADAVLTAMKRDLPDYFTEESA